MKTTQEERAGLRYVASMVTEQMRQWWRDGAARQKRDEKGRFVR